MFSYNYCRKLIQALQQQDYCFDSFLNQTSARSVILRHDVDFSPKKAKELADLEHRLGARSTYFFLLRTDFYNICSRSNVAILQEIHALGHQIGLHFDEEGCLPEEVPDRIRRECDLLAELCGVPISAFSMHRPSQAILDANLQLNGLINAYDHVFLKSYRYLSDSRRCWRDNPLQTITSGMYDKLHILTHPIWYHEPELSMGDTLRALCLGAVEERYDGLLENVRELEKDFPRQAIGGFDIE